MLTVNNHMKLIIALPYCSTDHQNATRLLQWIQELDKKVDHHLLLVADNAVPLDIKKSIDTLGKSVFTSAETIMIQCPVPANGNYHPAAAVMFERTAGHINSCHKWNWLWMEPDCVPLKPGWADSLFQAYEASSKRFMGSFANPNNENLPKTVMFATAVYPNGAHAELKQFCDGSRAFDMAFSDFVVPRAINTPLVWHRFGSVDNPPTFKEVKVAGDGPNTGTIDMIPKEAVFFHRNKNGTLIDLLRKRMSGPTMTLLPEFQDTTTIITNPSVPSEPIIPPIKRGPGRPRKVVEQVAAL